MDVCIVVGMVVWLVRMAVWIGEGGVVWLMGVTV